MLSPKSLLPGDADVVAKAHRTVADAALNLENAQARLRASEVSVHHARSISQIDLDHLKDKQDAVAKAADELKQANQGLAGAQAAVNEKGDKFNVTLDLLESRIKGAHEKTSDLKQAQNELGNEWRRLSDENGPLLEAALARLEKGLVGTLEWSRKVNTETPGPEVFLKSFKDLLDNPKLDGAVDAVHRLGEGVAKGVGPATDAVKQAASAQHGLADEIGKVVSASDQFSGRMGTAARATEAQTKAAKDQADGTYILSAAQHNAAERTDAARQALDYLGISRHADAERADEQKGSIAQLTDTFDRAGVTIDNQRLANEQLSNTYYSPGGLLDSFDRARGALADLEVANDKARDSALKLDVVNHTQSEHLDQDKASWANYLTTLRDAGALAHSAAERQDEETAALQRAKDQADAARDSFFNLNDVLTHLSSERHDVAVNVNTNYTSTGTPSPSGPSLSTGLSTVTPSAGPAIDSGAMGGMTAQHGDAIVSQNARIVELLQRIAGEIGIPGGMAAAYHTG